MRKRNPKDTGKPCGRWAALLTVLLWTGLFGLSAHAADDSVCARVKIEINQEMTLERQAFDAHMRITNGLSNISLADVLVTVTFADEQGHPVAASSDPADINARFFVRLSSMENISNIGGSGTVAAESTADIHWLIIPAPGAAMGAPQGTLYYVGASLSYSLGGEEHVTEVTPDYIYVKPLPKITLDYFLPGDVYGDDPFTSPIEPSIPFSLGVRAANHGSGVAKNLKIDSAQPKIVENDQGLLIGFVITGSEVNGHPVTPSLLVDFGDIAPNQASVARWVMTCSLSGKFVEFQADYSHSDELGGQLTSLLEDTQTHFLVRDVLVDLPGRDGIRDFLALDGAVYTVYESEIIDTPVTDQSGSANLSGSGNQYTLTTPVTAGFMVVKLSDPLGGEKAIKEVIRSDGKRIKAENAWFSKTRAGSGPWQHFLYVFDANSTGSYSLSFTEPAAAHAPVLQFISDRMGLEGTPISFLVEASDPDGTIPALSAAPLPAGAHFTDAGNGTGTFSWTPAVGQAGTYQVTYRAFDGAFADTKRAVLFIRSLADQDADGMNDAWEIAHFGNLGRDGSGDYDGDGLTDFEEFLRGTDPTVSNAPGSPRIVSPQEGSGVPELRPELAVENSIDPDGDEARYDFEVYADESLTILVTSGTNVAETPSTTSWIVPEEQPLDDNTHYFWRVRATDGIGYSRWAYGAFFVNTENDPPGAFQVSRPADGAQVDTQSPVLEVTNSYDVDEDTLTYSFEVYADSAMANRVAFATGLSEEKDGTTAWTVNQALEDNTRYYWRAIVTDEHGITAETALSAFFVNTANDAPDAPGLLSPADGAPVNATALALTVTNAADADGDPLTYDFELDRVNTFDSLQKRSAARISAGAGSTAWTVAGLEDNAWYFWRVRASDGVAASPWVQGRFFVNTTNDAPSAPTLKNPGQGSWVSSLTPTLELNPATDIDQDPITYRFEVFADAGLTSLVAAEETELPQFIVPAPLADNTWYYWRARAKDDGGLTSGWMPTASFFTNSNGVNDPPTITLLEPASELFTNAASFLIRWEDGDPETNARIDLYSFDPDDPRAGQALIAGNLEEDPDGEADTYLWDIAGLADGAYGVSATITDGESTVTAAAPGRIIIDRRPPVVGASPAGATYLSPQSVTLAADEPAIIYYTTDGSEPTTASAQYGAPLIIAHNVTLTFMAVDRAGNRSATVAPQYGIKDTDNDGMDDEWEVQHFGDLSHNGTGDTDNDGLSDLEEFRQGTDPLNPDTDADGIPDGWEAAHGLNPLEEDSAEDADQDGFTNLQEWFARTDPLNPASIPHAPHANAGPDANVPTGELVTLDGTASFDPDGDTITYLWSLEGRPATSQAVFIDPQSPQPTFTPDVDGTYLIRLTVGDGQRTSEDEVAVVAATQNVPPNARAGEDVDVAAGTTVVLDGRGSDDPDGGPQALSYRWVFDATPISSSLADADILDADLPLAAITPDVPGTYILRLKVSDGAASSEDTLTVRATAANVPPIADAGADMTLTLGEEALLDGTASRDPDDSPLPLAYTWRFVSLPTESKLANADIGGADTPTPAFTPDVAGTYVIELSVSDGVAASYDNVAVKVEAHAVTKPGDLDGDGVVGLSDYKILKSTLGKCKGQAGYIAAADYDGDGCVTLIDYFIWYIFFRLNK